MPLWNLVLSGYPGSGKTMLARRLVSENEDFVRLNIDDLRSMYFGESGPSEEEDFVYDTLVTLRDAALGRRRSVVIDTTAPENSMRRFLLNTRVRNATQLLIVMVVDKGVLEDRNRKRHSGWMVEAWDESWQSPSSNMPVMKFRNNSTEEFETSYYILTDLLSSKVHPYHRRFFTHTFPRL